MRRKIKEEEKLPGNGGVPIIDLHCDLLSYLENQLTRTANDDASRCSLSQLQQGMVKIQTFAIYTLTASESVKKGVNQARIFHELPQKYPKNYVHYSPEIHVETSPYISGLMAFENASGFCGEDEKLEEGLKRLKKIIQNVAKPFYISMTWNHENRFGGGAATQIGLKADGRVLLEELHQQGIAIDLSHASDPLAYEIIDFIEGRNLDIRLIASHSNARHIVDVPRNLPNDIAVEIFKRGGVVGLNLYHKFVGENAEWLPKHLAHWLELGGENHIAIGADFFYDQDHEFGANPFFNHYQNASCYGTLCDLVHKELRLDRSLLEKFAFRNALEFIQKSSYINHLLKT